MAIVDINCPHCGNKQKVATKRLKGTAMCMHCGKEIEDVYLYKVAPPKLELKNKLKGTIVSEFGQTKLDDIESENAFVRGEDEDEQEDETKRSSDTGFIDRVHMSNLHTTSVYTQANQQALSSKARTYVIGAVVTVILLAVGTVVVVQNLPEDINKSEVTTTTGPGERVEKYETGAIKVKWTVKKLAGGTLAIDGSWKEFYRNGNLKVDGNYVDGLRQGKWATFHENSSKASLVSFVDDKEHGKEVHWHNNGQVEFKGKWADGEKTGVWNSWHSNARLAEEIRYKDGLPDGSHFTYFANGEADTSGEYVMGQKQDLWTSYYEDGTEKEVSNWENGKLHGDTVAHFVNGGLEYEGKWDNGLRTGNWTWYSRSGSVIEKGAFVEGNRNGPFSYFHSNGIAKEIGEFDAGKRVGEWVESASDGKVISRRNYENDQVVSAQYFFQGIEVVLIERKDDNDKLTETWTVRKDDGKKHGDYKKFFPNGEIKEYGQWLDDQKHGVWRMLDVAGNTVSESEYENGVKK